MHRIIIQIVCDKKTFVPKRSSLRKWAKSALLDRKDACEVTVRVVGIDEMTALNLMYRHKEGPTNVLSFPFDALDAPFLEMPILGDIIICGDIVNKEAKEQGKLEEAHWAHMIVHGMFHLQGHDHEVESDAAIMESLEITTLQHLGFTDPYEHGETIKHHD
jgi:probable rRNA maturation factor